MVPSKMIRQRSLLAYNLVYGVSVEEKSMPQQSGAVDGGGAIAPTASLQLSASSLSAPVCTGLLWRHRAENFLWLVSAAFIIYYGDFRSSLFSLILNDPRVRRTPLHLGFACFITDIAIVLYLAVQLRNIDRMEKIRLEAIAADAVPVATAVGVAAFILFSVALWPIWNILTVPMLFTLFMALVVMVPYLPSSVNGKVKADSLHYICIRCE